ncbi:MAG: PorV/PorQ family protein [Candidatus Krumholzibacteriia bacterium]
MRRLTAIIQLLIVLMAGAAAAQTKTGTTIGQFLGIEPGARHAGMGNAGVALAGGIEAVWFNPGVIGSLDGPAITVTHSNWFADISYNYLAAAFGLGRLGNLCASVTALNSGDIAVRTVNAPLGTGEQYDVANTAIGLGFGRRITSRFSAGLQVNYVHERIWHTGLSATTASLGTVYRLSEQGMQLGFSLSNLGTRAGYSGGDLSILYDADGNVYGDNSALPGEQTTGEFPVPILFRMGLSYPHRFSDDSRLLFVIDALHPNDNTESVNLGAEWTLQKMFALRAGYQTLFQQDSDLGLTLGFGVLLSDSRLRFGYAWADHAQLGSTHRMTLAIGL